jgi:hypothetical protein
MKVGAISVDVDGNGVSGDFTSTFGGPPPTMAAAAAKCNEDHFNWYQIVSGTHPLIPGGGPQVDPLPESQGLQWADKLPWYWDETTPPPGTPGFEAGLQLSANTFAGRLHYEDFPGGPEGTDIMFMTWLVSLNADGSFHSWHEGFSWTWKHDATGITVGAPVAKGAGVIPTKAEYDDLIGDFDRPIPEPGTLPFLVIGLAALGVHWRRRQRT